MNEEYNLEFEIWDTVNGQVIVAMYWEGSRTGIEGLGKTISEALINLARDCNLQGFDTRQDIQNYMLKGSENVFRGLNRE